MKRVIQEKLKLDREEESDYLSWIFILSRNIIILEDIILYIDCVEKFRFLLTKRKNGSIFIEDY